MPVWLFRILAFACVLPPDRLRVRLDLRQRHGSPHLMANANLLVQRQNLEFSPFPWRVDSGASITRINWQRACDAGFPTHEAGPAIVVRERTAERSRDVNIRCGTLCVRLHSRQRSAPFRLPVWYVLDPFPIPLLGLGGVVDQLSWVIDGRFWNSDFPCGYCLLTDCRRPHERFPG
jgi:hypothetical protein